MFHDSWCYNFHDRKVFGSDVDGELPDELWTLTFLTNVYGFLFVFWCSWAELYNGAQYQPMEIFAATFFLKFFGKCTHIYTCCPLHYVLLWKLSFLHFLQGSRPKLLNWSHPCIHWQLDWIAIPVGSSKFWFQSSYSKYISFFSHTYLFLFPVLFITFFLY